MKIAFFEVEEWEKSHLQGHFEGEDITLIPDILNEQHMPVETDAEAICVFVNSRVTEEVINRFPNLKLIATRSTGFDHIDLAAAKKRGIVVCYVPGYGDNTVAEFAFGLMLMLSRKLYNAAFRVKETASFALDGLRGFDLQGKTLGVVGTGRIGKCVIKIAQGFGMKVVAYDIFIDPEFAKTSGVSYLSFEELLEASDIITFHCLLTEQTKHLINKNNVDRIKKGALIINTARGPIIETEALVYGLQNGIIAGAGLDVLEDEGQTKDEIHALATKLPPEELKTILENHMLMKMPNVLVTPHNAFNSNEALERILNTTAENIKAFMAGKPTNRVE